MNKRILFSLTFVLLALSACNLPARQTKIDEFGAALDRANPEQATATLPNKTATATQVPLPPATRPVSNSGVPIVLLEPGEVIITFVDMHTANAGWAFGGQQDPGGHVLYTKDGGQTWQDVTPPEPQDDDGLAKIPQGFFLDENTGWVTFDYAERFIAPVEPIIWFTDDAGENWQAVGKLNNRDLITEDYEINFMQFSDAEHGWIMIYLGAGMSHRYTALFGTADGGATWNRLIDPFDDSTLQLCEKTGMHFADAMTGWITLDCFGVVDGTDILYTQDGGRNWTLVEIPLDQFELGTSDLPPYCYTHSPNAIDLEASNTLDLHIGLACKTILNDDLSTQNFILYSTDQGMTWDFLPYAGGSLQRVAVAGAAHSTNDLLYILSTEISSVDILLKTKPSLIKKTLWQGQFSFVGLETAWAVARNDGEIALVYTTDGGSNWQIIDPVVIP